MHLNQKQISIRLQQIMTRLGLNQKTLAETLKITQPAVSKYLKERIPPPAVLVQLADLADTTIEWILTGQSSYSSKKVSEKTAIYSVENTLQNKIKLLPPEIQVQLEKLIEQLLLSLNIENL